MTPRLVVCRCCATGRPAMAVCSECERRQLHAALLKRGLVADNPIDRDADDRLYDRAMAHELEASA